MSRRNNFRRGASRISRSGGSNKKNKSGGVTWNKLNPPSLDKLQGQLPVQPGVDPADMVAVPVVLIPGDYKDEEGQSQDTYVFRFHKYTTQEYGRTQYPELPCISGPAHAQKDCIGCLNVERKVWKDSSDTKENILVNIAHLVNYHKIPWVKDGQVQTRKGSNEPIMITKECWNSTVEGQLYLKRSGKTCQGCDSGAEFVLGSRRYLQIGWGNQKKFEEFQEDVLSRRCKKCGTGAVEVALKCPACNTIQHSLASGGYTMDSIRSLREDPQTCNNSACVHANSSNQMFLRPQYQCGYNDDLMGARPDGVKCPDGIEAEPYSIYDVVIWLMRKGEGTDSRYHVHKWVPLEQFPWPGTDQTVDLRTYIPQIVPSTFDFDTMFNIDTDAQAKQLKVQNPFASSAPSHGAPPPQATAHQTVPQLPSMPPPAQPNAGYNPQQAQPAIATPYPTATPAPGMPPATGRPDWGGENQ